MWQWPGCVDPGNTLGDETPHTSGDRGIDEIARTLVAQACVGLQNVRSQRACESLRQIRELMHYNVRTRLAYGMRHSNAVEHVQQHRGRSELFQLEDLFRRSSRANDNVSGVDQLRHEPSSYCTACTSQKDLLYRHDS